MFITFDRRPLAIAASKVEDGPDGGRGQTTRHHVIDFDLCPPASAVPWHEDMRIQSLEVLDGLFDESFVRSNQVVPPNDSMQWRTLARQLKGVLAGVDDACVAATREYYHSLICISFSWV